MKKLVLIFLLLGFSELTLGQEGLDLRQTKEVEMALGESSYFHLASRPFVPGITNLEELKTQLEIDLKASLAKKIISKVRLEDKSKSVSLSIKDQSNSKNNSLKEVTNFEFNSNIESEITFTDLKPLFQEDAKNRRIYGLVSINKAKFLGQNLAKILYALNKLLEEVSSFSIQNPEHARVIQLKYNDYLKQKNDIYSLIEVQNMLEPGRIPKEEALLSQISSLEKYLTDMLTIVESGQFQLDLLEVKEKLHAEDFKGALGDFEKMAITYPGNPTLLTEKVAALDLIADSFKDKIASSDYLFALQTIKFLEGLDRSFSTRYFEIKKILVKRAFDSYLSKAEASVSNKDYIEAKFLLDKIRDFRYFDSSRFDQLERRIEDTIFSDKIVEIDQKASNGNFVEAFKLIVTTKREFPLRNMSEIIYREQSVIEALTDQKVKEIKAQRPMTWQLQVGGGLISNFYTLPTTDLSNYTIATASSVGEVGIYKKTGIKKVEGFDGVPMYSANAVGFRLGVWYPNKVFKSPIPGAVQYDAGLYLKSTVFEPQISFYLLRFCNMNFGKMVGDIVDAKSNTVINTKSDYYTFTLGIRPRIGSLMLNINGKLVSDMANKNYITVQATLNLAIDFVRRFKETERSEIRNAVSRMKDSF
jgi:hypothetical protein